MCHSPIVIKATRALFQRFDNEIYIPEIGVGMSNWCLLEQVLAQWWCLVAFMKAMDLLHRAMSVIVPAHRHGHQNGQHSGHILHFCYVCCSHGGRRGNREWVVAQWWHLVAFMKALDLLHQAMNVVLHRCTAMTIEMACNGGAFIPCHRLFCLA